LNIVLIFNNRGKNDEGMKNLGFQLSRQLAYTNQVSEYTPQEFTSPLIINRLRSMKPEIIHYIPGPTIRSLVILKICKLILPKAYTVASASKPFFSSSQIKLLNLFKPDIVLTQDPTWEQTFIEKKIKTRFLAIGVDKHTFKPIETSEKVEIRKSFSLPFNKKILFHAGHIRNNRNLEVLMDIQKKTDWQVVVAASSALEKDEPLFENLKKNGVLVINRYIENIEKLYACSDAYIFPTLPSFGLPTEYNQIGVIDMPLSVLEAMATNLPVITTKFPSLSRVFSEDNGYCYFDGTFAGFKEKETQLLGLTNNREKVSKYDWGSVASDLINIYEGLLYNDS